MKPKMCYLVSLCCFLTLLSCGKNNISSSLPNETELYNTQWVFRAFEVIEDTIEILPPDHQYFLLFGEGLQGETDYECVNSYDGEYAIRPPSNISIGPIGSTRAFCRESYWRYLDELK